MIRSYDEKLRREYENSGLRNADMKLRDEQLCRQATVRSYWKIPEMEGRPGIGVKIQDGIGVQVYADLVDDRNVREKAWISLPGGNVREFLDSSRDHMCTFARKVRCPTVHGLAVCVHKAIEPMNRAAPYLSTKQVPVGCYKLHEFMYSYFGESSSAHILHLNEGGEKFQHIIFQAWAAYS